MKDRTKKDGLRAVDSLPDPVTRATDRVVILKNPSLHFAYTIAAPIGEKERKMKRRIMY